MARFILNLDLRKKQNKSLLLYLSDMGLIESKIKSSMEESLEDIKAGRIHSYESAEEMFKELGIDISNYN